MAHMANQPLPVLQPEWLCPVQHAEGHSLNKNLHKVQEMRRKKILKAISDISQEVFCQLFCNTLM